MFVDVNINCNPLSASRGRFQKISTGIYTNCMFNFPLVISDDIEQYPNFDDVPLYGVCDSVEQFIEKYGTVLENSVRRFAVGFTEVVQTDQPKDGGWRWHKWGLYIGVKEHSHEYLYDDVGIDSVFTFRLVEIV